MFNWKSGIVMNLKLILVNVFYPINLGPAKRVVSELLINTNQAKNTTHQILKAKK